MSATHEEAVEGLTRAGAAEPPFLTRIRLRARRRIGWLRQLWAHEGSTSGLAISHEEVDRILGEPGDLARAELLFYRTQPAARALDVRIRAADATALLDPHVASVRKAFALSDTEVDLLTLAAAVEVDPWFRRVLGYLHDDATSALPTPWLASELFHWPAEAGLGPDSNLVRWRLAKPADSEPSPWARTAAWLADPTIVACLTHGPRLDPRIAAATLLVRPAETPPRRCLYSASWHEMVSFVRTLQGDGASIEVVLKGSHGAG
jgi:hypothetical protein